MRIHVIMRQNTKMSYMTDLTDLHRQNLKNFMTKRKLTCYGWSKLSGISEGTIRSYLAGRSSSLNYKTLNKLANSIGVKPIDIIEEGNNQNYGENIIKSIFEESMIKVDQIIALKKLNLSDEQRRSLYFAWYELKVNKLKQSDNEITLSVLKDIKTA